MAVYWWNYYSNSSFWGPLLYIWRKNEKRLNPNIYKIRNSLNLVRWTIRNGKNCKEGVGEGQVLLRSLKDEGGGDDERDGESDVADEWLGIVLKGILENGQD